LGILELLAAMTGACHKQAKQANRKEAMTPKKPAVRTFKYQSTKLQAGVLDRIVAKAIEGFVGELLPVLSFYFPSSKIEVTVKVWPA
jgi:hypothetical protein